MIEENKERRLMMMC